MTVIHALEIPVAATLVIFMLMIAEATLAERHDRRLLAQGGVEARGDVYPIMRVVYPACFLAMAVESAVIGPPPRGWLLAGLALFAAAKALKYWAIATLGERWSFRVIVLPDVPLVTKGPYRWLRHPNYVGVVGELAGAAVLLHAPVTGAASLVVFGVLLVQRIRVEERALHRDREGRIVGE
ncbi:MAG TPA: isoprenylcysteine carboxylmethyltransferase family protein [Vicinamibacterales bacterium]|nr:isoprenylcysteine carboxylmethyltransferase family protein [Vicinamibacterales bacterium]